MKFGRCKLQQSSSSKYSARWIDLPPPPQVDVTFILSLCFISFSYTYINFKAKNVSFSDVEQTAMTFLDSNVCLKSMHKGREHLSKSWALELESHEIWQAEVKRSSKQLSWVSYGVPPKKQRILLLRPQKLWFFHL